MYTQSVIIDARHLETVQSQATESGLELTISEPSIESVRACFAGSPYLAIFKHAQREEIYREMQAKYRKVEVFVSGTPVSAMAEDVGGGHVKYVSIDRDFDWTAHGLDVDFAKCDKCGKAICRKKVWICADGRQLGGNCAESESSQFAAMLRSIDLLKKQIPQDELLEEGWGGCGGRSPYVSVDAALRFAWFLVARDGYTRSTNWEPSPNKSGLIYLLFARGKEAEKARRAVCADTTYDHEQAKADTEAWIATLDNDNEFGRNVKAAWETGHTSLLGIFAYIPEGVRRWKQDRLTTGLLDGTQVYAGNDSDAEKLATFTAEELGVSERVYAKMLTGKISKANRKKLDRALAGEWVVAWKKNGFSQWTQGNYTLYKLVRQSDRAVIVWKQNERGELELLDKVRIIGCSGELGEFRRSAQYRISRVRCFRGTGS